MLFSPIIKKNFKFLSLTFFVFFISCAVNAQDELKQNVNAIIQGEKNIKTDAVSEPKIDSATKIGDAKTQIGASKKTTKKIYKKSKKKKKKIHKIMRKRIIKKVYVIKNDEEKKAKEVSEEKVVEKNEVDESLEKYKKGELNNFQEIEGEYLIEAELKDNCDRATSGQCFRGDKFFQEPYFHYTILTIFDQNKRFFKDSKKFIKNFQTLVECVTCYPKPVNTMG